MKYFIQCGLIVFTMSLSLFSYAAPEMPDKFGNGGAVWACETQTGEVMDLMLIDIDEARRENKLTIPETNTDHIAYLQDKKSWIQKNLSIQFVLMPHIEYVEQNINWIEGEMILVPDIANVSKPSPTLCRGGRWEARTVVNFGDDGRVLASKELFQSPFLTEMERTALFLHEGIYSYMRTEFGDQNSRRSRHIVGYIMSDLPDAKKIESIMKVLEQTGTTPAPPTPQIGGYVCGIRPTSSSPLYIAEKKTEVEARKAALNECIQGEKIGFPFSFDFPGVPPGFPGDGGGFGPERECTAKKVACETIQTSQKKYTCFFTNFSRSKRFEGKGRTRLEAQKDAENTCLINGEMEHSCNSPRDLTCN